ncbi:hypothetical protein [Nonomuraea polychroma]|uniref:hypothetical protein n=1 Tax=Nonomuraea polychroma TaxID=46176 RepID=UPI000FDEBDD8|nr:hypothetical protein [Nonomuraea polychroma]
MEILDLKLRVKELESSTGPNGVNTAIGIAVAQAIAQIAYTRAEITQDLAALGDEIAGLRRQVNEQITPTRSDALEQYATLRSDLNHLKLRLDRLLDKEGAQRRQ